MMTLKEWIAENKAERIGAFYLDKSLISKIVDKDYHKGDCFITKNGLQFIYFGDRLEEVSPDFKDRIIIPLVEENLFDSRLKEVQKFLYED